MNTRRHLRLFLCAGFCMAAVLTLNLAGLAQTATYTEATINSFASVNDPAPDALRSYTGADVQLGPIGGTRNLAFASGSNFVVKSVTDNVFAKGSLATGTLKTKALLQLGANIFVGGSGITVGSRNGSASGSAAFADSFRTFSGNTPFLWSNGTTATFHFAVTGQVNIAGTVPNPYTSSEPKPLNLVYALLTVNIYKAGTIDLLRQFKEFNFSAYPDSTTANAAFFALINQIEANLITRDYWYFGDVKANFAVDPAKVLPIDPAAATNVDFTFTPGGDFDWVALLDTTVQLDAAQQAVGATLDFSNSMVSTYDGPAGTTTYSGSGVYPSTLPQTQAPPAKCPTTMGFWKNNPNAWPISSLILGAQLYSKAELLQLLGTPGGGDASAILAVQLIGAKLNMARGSATSPIYATTVAADQTLAAFSGKFTYNVKPNSTAGQSMTASSVTLESYNKGLLTPNCTP